jgi:hypothetical protein
MRRSRSTVVPSVPWTRRSCSPARWLLPGQRRRSVLRPERAYSGRSPCRRRGQAMHRWWLQHNRGQRQRWRNCGAACVALPLPVQLVAASRAPPSSVRRKAGHDVHQATPILSPVVAQTAPRRRRLDRRLVTLMPLPSTRSAEKPGPVSSNHPKPIASPNRGDINWRPGGPRRSFPAAL